MKIFINKLFFSPDHAGSYKGFVVDLLEELIKKLHFNYELVFAPDNNYGVFNHKTKKWTGMMGMLVEGDADMIIADLTETAKRREAADFTSPYLTTGIGIMYHQVTRQELPFHNLEELVAQNDVQYGVLRHGSTYDYIRRGNNETFVKMSQYFDSHPEVLVSNVLEGVKKVMNSNGKYAYLGEAVAYHVLKKQKYPDLILVGDTFFPRQFGIVFPKGAKDRDVFDNILTELRTEGVLDALAKKWSLV